MDRNESITIRPAQNGYIVEYSYRLMKQDSANEFDYRWQEEKNIYNSWDDVVKYITDKKLTVPALN